MSSFLGFSVIHSSGFVLVISNAQLTNFPTYREFAAVARCPLDLSFQVVSCNITGVVQAAKRQEADPIQSISF